MGPNLHLRDFEPEIGGWDVRSEPPTVGNWFHTRPDPISIVPGVRLIFLEQRIESTGSLVTNRYVKQKSERSIVGTDNGSSADPTRGCRISRKNRECTVEILLSKFETSTSDAFRLVFDFGVFLMSISFWRIFCLPSSHLTVFAIRRSFGESSRLSPAPSGTCLC